MKLVIPAKQGMPGLSQHADNWTGSKTVFSSLSQEIQLGLKRGLAAGLSAHHISSLCVDVTVVFSLVF